MGRGGAPRSVMRTLPVVLDEAWTDEAWTMIMTRIAFEGSPAAAVVVGRRTLRRERLPCRRVRGQAL